MLSARALELTRVRGAMCCQHQHMSTPALRCSVGECGNQAMSHGQGHWGHGRGGIREVLVPGGAPARRGPAAWLSQLLRFPLWTRLLQCHAFATVVLPGLCCRKCPLEGSLGAEAPFVTVTCAHVSQLSMAPTEHLGTESASAFPEGSPGVVGWRPLSLRLTSEAV